MDITPQDEISYTTEYHEGFLKYVKNEYSDQHWCMAVNKLQTVPSSNLLSSPAALGSYQSRLDPYDFSSDDEEYLTPTNVAETKPRRSDHAASILTAPRLYLNSPLETP